VVRVVSLFCGGGFADYALHLASKQTGIPVEVVYACDSWDKAVAVYNANLPTPAVVADVKKLSRQDLPPHDLVIGGPPCQDHSLAGQRACRCDRGEPATDRCCLADFVRLSRGSAWLMENVRPRLIHDGWSEKFDASDFGDVTTRKRWFYSSHILHVVPTPGPRRIRDIRDYKSDEQTLKDRGWAEQPLHIVTHRPRVGSQGGEPYPTIGYNDGFFASFTADNPRAYSGKTLRLGMRGHSASASASAFNDDEFLGSFVSNTWHGNEQSKLDGCRNPTLLEMARAHSIPDSWDWAGVTKTAKGQIIANGWPIGLGTGVLVPALRAVAFEKARAA